MESLIKYTHNLFISKQISCTQFIREKLDRLKKNRLNSVNSLLESFALKRAAEVDEKLSKNQEIGLLEGIPFGIKDVYMLKGTISTASSDFLKNYTCAYTATAIQKLLDKGAIPIVKENCDCFGHGSSSENTIFGAVKNATNPSLVAGGSSGGSATNVAAGHTLFSIGGDTGGSIRQPAGYNKVFGLKPTYGRVSRFGLMAYASSTDCVGPIATTLEDIRIVLNVISGVDKKDQTTYVSKNIEKTDITKKSVNTVGYYKEFIKNDTLDNKIRNSFLDSLEKLRKNGIEIKELDFFNPDVLVSTYYILAMAETASNLARLDGSSYGTRIENEQLKQSYFITRSVNFTEETKNRIIAGNQVLAQGYSEEIYLKALSIRDEISQNFDKSLKKVDIILSPVSPNTPPRIGESLKNTMAMYLSDVYTVGFSLGKLPTLTIPIFTPCGVQITAAKDNEKTIFDFANFLQKRF